MKMVTVSGAKSRLSAYIKAAEEGEEIVIMRGSKPAVMLRPVTEADLALSAEFSTATLADFEKEVAADRSAGRLKKLGDSPAEAAVSLRRR